MTSQPRRGLGRGLDALIPSAPPGASAPSSGNAQAAGVAAELDIDLIAPNPEQPRTHFQPEKLRELADSIREHGIIQPLIVSRDTGGGYQLIAGERRLQAARLAGLATVPVVFHQANGRDSLEIALIENIQRADLNPLEEASAYRRLVDEHGLTQEDAARRVGKSRAAVANAMRLLALEPEIRGSLVAGEVSEGHARALLALPAGKARLDAWREVVRRRLSVRETEALARRATEVQPASRQRAKKSGEPREPGLVDIETRLRRRLSTRVTVVPQGDGARITVECYSRDELDGVVSRLLGEE
jgi:ParB family chromosome partitioning protein